ncbi:aspartyl protease [Candidatus Roizmanbacteria bacterium]|nr:aspartyl protease [Candidatus Roizmanbacteria bacterium]
MAITYLKVKIANPLKPKNLLDRKVLVDSGAVYSVIPKSDLAKLAIKPEGTQKFILANGEEIEKKVGEAKFYYQGRGATSKVVFGNEGVYLLGLTTLENLGMILDPLSRELKPLPMLLM